MTGEECATCPWHSFHEPVVADVIELNRAVGDGSPAALLAMDVPAHLWEGLLLYRRSADLTRARNDEEDDAQKRARDAAIKAANKANT